MSRRPKFWNHRSGRFWRGFGIFLFLFGAWILTMFSYTEVGYLHYGLPSSRFATLKLGNGGLQGIWTTHTYKIPGSGTPSPHSEWVFKLRESNGANLAPEFSRRERDDHFYFSETRSHLFLPLWLPVLGWIILWFYRMHRQDKQEEMFFGSQPEGGDEETTPLSDS